MGNAVIIINLLGGASKLSSRIGVPRSTINMWKFKKPTGCGGYIPYKYHEKLTLLANELSIEIPKF